MPWMNYYISKETQLNGAVRKERCRKYGNWTKVRHELGNLKRTAHLSFKPGPSFSEEAKKREKIRKMKCGDAVKKETIFYVKLTKEELLIRLALWVGRLQLGGCKNFIIHKE
ncbi:unnamed protein product [Dovyalis caffra]|uniref:GIY-YIG homing endonuclease n=1 Tax=Dovyalis caffra TaxID=77055 RepID=A0AAV1RV74_9ROSI|nr:unnamed protein product [Dovyalis caffra]